MVYTINSVENLRHARIYYHDAVFFIDEITFDKQSGIFSLPMSRLLFEDIVLKKSYVFFKIWLLPRMKSRLTFYQVHEMEKKAEYEKDIVIAIDYDPKHQRIRFNCANDSVIILHVTELNGMIEDVGEKLFDNSRIVSFFGIKNRCGF